MKNPAFTQFPPQKLGNHLRKRRHPVGAYQVCFSCLYPAPCPLQNRPQLRVLALQGPVSLATFCNATFAEPQGVLPALHIGAICRMLHLDKDQVAFRRDPGGENRKVTWTLVVKGRHMTSFIHKEVGSSWKNGAYYRGIFRILQYHEPPSFFPI